MALAFYMWATRGHLSELLLNVVADKTFKVTSELDNGKFGRTAKVYY